MLLTILRTTSNMRHIEYHKAPSDTILNTCLFYIAKQVDRCSKHASTTVVVHLLPEVLRIYLAELPELAIDTFKIRIRIRIMPPLVNTWYAQAALYRSTACAWGMRLTV